MLKLAVCVALVGCGSSKDEPKPDKPTVETPVPPKPDSPVARPPTPAPPANSRLGECTFTVSGASTRTTSGSVGGITLSYWELDPKMREAMYKDKQGFIITCGNGESALSFTANKLTADELPFGPKKYELKKGVSLSNKIHVIGSSPDGGIVGAEGTLDITAMDSEHVAGAFEFKSQLMKKDKGGLAPIEVKGSFDYKCPRKCK